MKFISLYCYKKPQTRRSFSACSFRSLLLFYSCNFFLLLSIPEQREGKDNNDINKKILIPRKTLRYGTGLYLLVASWKSSVNYFYKYENIAEKKNLEFMKIFPDKKKPQTPIKVSSSCFTRRGRLLIKHKFRNNKSSFNGRLCSYTLSCSFFLPPWKAILEHLSFKLHFYLIFVCIYTI